MLAIVWAGFAKAHQSSGHGPTSEISVECGPPHLAQQHGLDDGTDPSTVVVE